MSVIPKIQELLNQLNLMKPYLIEMDYRPNQSNTRETLANLTSMYMTNYDKSVITYDDVVMHGNYPVPVRIYLPKLDQSFPVAVFIHGGGHMAGSITVYDKIVRNLARVTGHIIVSIEYRLAPEFPYPTGINDCKAAIRGIFQLLQEHKINYASHELAIMGDSAGGAICASITMDKEFIAIEQIKRQVLIYPSLDYTGTSPSLDKFGEGYLLEKSKIEFYFNNYFLNGEDRKTVSPLYGEFYANMPATLVITAAYDPLLAEAVAYYSNVVKVGAKAELVNVDGMVHAYLMLEDLCQEECARTYQEINKFLQA